jgi:hypothetical protein
VGAEGSKRGGGQIAKRRTLAILVVARALTRQSISVAEIEDDVSLSSSSPILP